MMASLLPSLLLFATLAYGQSSVEPYLVPSPNENTNSYTGNDVPNYSTYNSSSSHWTGGINPGRLDSITAGSTLEEVFLYYSEWPTGIAVAKSGRKFSNFPRSDPKNVNYTVGELLGNSSSGYYVSPYPSAKINLPPIGAVNHSTFPATGSNYQDYLVSVQSVVIDPADRLWILDTGRPDSNGTMVGSAYGGPKLIGVDLSTNEVFTTIVFQPDVVYSDSYVNDVRFDLRPSLTSSGKGVAYITDSSSEGRNAIIIVDLGTGFGWRHLQGIPEVRAENRFLPFIWGEPFYMNNGIQPITYFSTGADGIALSADGSTLYWTPNAGRHLYSIDTSYLLQNGPYSEILAIGAVRNHGEKGASDGMETDSNGLIYFADYEASSMMFWNSSTGITNELTRDPRLGWQDTLSVGFDGYLYFTSNQYHLQSSWRGGVDERKTPYILFRVPTVNGASKVTNLQ